MTTEFLLLSSIDQLLFLKLELVMLSEKERHLEWEEGDEQSEKT